MNIHTAGRRMLAAGLVVAGLTAASAGSASSAQAATRIAGTDSVLIPASNFDFGGKTFKNGAPTDAGSLEWRMDDGIPAPRLKGFIHFKNANNSCAYMQLLYLNSSGTVLHTTNGGEVCVTDNDHHKFKVDFGTYANIFTAKVTVNLLSVTGLGTSVEGARTVNLGPYVDEVQVDEDGFDFGSTGWTGDAPAGNGLVTWTYNLGPRARLTGAIHLDGVAGACGRMQLEYVDWLGHTLGTENGGKVCATDNSHQAWTVDFGGTFTSTDVTAVKVNVQSLGVDGVYRTAGSDTATFSSLLVIGTPI